MTVAAELFTADGVPTMDLAGMHRSNDTDTAIRAAKVVSITCAETDRVRVLHLLADAGERGLTDYCLAHLMSTPGNPRKQTSVGKRRGELMGDGLVVRRKVIDPRSLLLVDDRRVPLAGSAQSCAVWVTVGNQRAEAGS